MTIKNKEVLLRVSVLLRFITVATVIMDVTPSPRRSFEIVSPLTDTDFEENYAIMETFNQIFEIMKVSNIRLNIVTSHTKYMQ